MTKYTLAKHSDQTLKMALPISMARRSLSALTAFSFFLMNTTAMATSELAPHALPQGGNVMSGNVEISQPTDKHLVIQQGSDKAIINWESFSIGKDAHTEFQQPSSDSVALNRVVGGNMSEIMGRLTANGDIFLINPNGIVMGKDAMVDVHGLTMSTLDITNENFNRGRYEFSLPANDRAGHIENQGTITVQEGGMAAFVAPSMHNSGLIQGKASTVVMASGEEVVLDLYGDKLTQVALVSKEVQSTPKDHQGKPVKSLVSNTGRIEGKKVLLTVQAAREIVDHVINQEGIIDVSSVREQGGTIILEGGTQGHVNVPGDLLAHSDQGQGGSVGVFGEHIKVEGNVSASGCQEGGDVLLGGNYHGQSTAEMMKENGKIRGYKGKGQKIFASRNATSTRVTPAAKVSATSPEGRSGKIIVYSQDTTEAQGEFHLEGQDGGFLEVSAKNASKSKDYKVDLRKIFLKGEKSQGSVLFDPKNITVQAAGAVPYHDGVNNRNGNNPGTDIIFSPGDLDGIGADIVLEASNDITIADDLDLSTNMVKLDLNAGRSVIINAPVNAIDDIRIVANRLVFDGMNHRDEGDGDIILNSDLTRGGFGNINLQLYGPRGTGEIKGTGVITASFLHFGSQGPVKLSGKHVIDELLNSSSYGGFNLMVNNHLGLVVGDINTGPIKKDININNKGGSIHFSQDINNEGADINLTAKGNIRGAYSLTAKTLTAVSEGTVDLNSSTNAITILAASSSGGDFTLNNSTSLTVEGIDTTIGLPAGGHIFIDNDVNNLIINGSLVGSTDPAQPIYLTGKNITGAGLLKANTLLVDGKGNVNLTGDNEISILYSGVRSQGPFLFTNNINLKVNNIITDVGGTGLKSNITLNSKAGNLVLAESLDNDEANISLAGKDISSFVGVTLTANTLTVKGSGNVDFEEYLTITTLAPSSSGGNFTIRSREPLTVQGIDTTVGLPVGGDITLVTLDDLLITGPLKASNVKGDDMYLSGKNITGAGILTGHTLQVVGSGTVNLTGDNKISSLDSATSQGPFLFTNNIDLNVNDINTDVGSTGLKSDITLNSKAGNLLLKKPLGDVTTNLSLAGNNISSFSTALLSANTLTVNAMNEVLLNAPNIITTLAVSSGGQAFQIKNTVPLIVEGINVTRFIEDLDGILINNIGNNILINGALNAVDNDITLIGANITSAGALVGNFLNIEASGAIDLTGIVTSHSLQIEGHNSVSLSGANQIEDLADSYSQGPFLLNNTIDLTVDNINTDIGTTGVISNIDLHNGAGNLTLDADEYVSPNMILRGKDIIARQRLNVTNLTVQASGIVSLTGANHLTNLMPSSSNGDFTINSTSEDLLNISSIDTAGQGNINVTTAGPLVLEGILSALTKTITLTGTSMEGESNDRSAINAKTLVVNASGNVDFAKLDTSSGVPIFMQNNIKNLHGTSAGFFDLSNIVNLKIKNLNINNTTDSSGVGTVGNLLIPGNINVLGNHPLYLTSVSGPQGISGIGNINVKDLDLYADTGPINLPGENNNVLKLKARLKGSFFFNNYGNEINSINVNTTGLNGNNPSGGDITIYYGAPAKEFESLVTELGTSGELTLEPVDRTAAAPVVPLDPDSPDVQSDITDTETTTEIGRENYLDETAKLDSLITNSRYLSASITQPSSRTDLPTVTPTLNLYNDVTYTPYSYKGLVEITESPVPLGNIIINQNFKPFVSPFVNKNFVPTDTDNLNDFNGVGNENFNDFNTADTVILETTPGGVKIKDKSKNMKSN